jgi:hypothetical protein
MARKFMTPIDMTQLEILNARIQVLSSVPGGPNVTGQVYFNSTTLKLYVCTVAGSPGTWVAADGSDIPDSTITSAKIADGTIVNADIAAGAAIVKSKLASLGIVDADVAAGAAIALSKLATDPLARANHTGTQVAATISDLATVVQAYRLDQFAVPTADLNVNTHKLTNVVNPTGAQDAATKSYVDAVKTGLDVKDSVRAATTAAGTLASSFANTSVIDGVTLATGDRILIKDQAAGAENGIYVVQAAGAPVRAIDADTNAEVTSGMYTFVTEGTVNGDTGWLLTTNDPIVLATTALAFAQFSSSAAVTGGAGLLKTGTVIDAVAGTTPATAAGPGGGLKMNADDMVIDATIVARKYTTALAGAATSYVVNHALSNQWVNCQVFRNTTPWDEIDCDIELTDANNVTVRFAVAPATNAYRAVVTG